MNEPLIIIESGNTRGRLIAAAAIVAALIFGWFAIRWQLGNMFSELTLPTDPNAAQVANLAASLAPSDPMPKWLAASKAREDFTEEGSQKAVELLETAVRLGPEDYRWWIELGRAYEQADRPQDAETAFRRAIDVAPEYTFPRWQFGNFLIRQDRADDAFVELKEATRKSAIYREQVFSLAWDYFGKDPQRVEQLAADTPEVRANLALFYAVRGASEDSLRMWNSLSDEMKAEHVATAKVIAQGLHDKRRFRQAIEFARQTGIDPEAQQEKITNGGFESALGKPEDTLFGWRVMRTDSRVDVSTDPSVKREGNRSLKINFRGYDKRDFANVTQIVAVQPSARYRLSFMLRTENLKSGGPPFLEVLNTADDSVIAATQPFATGTSDWQQINLEFTVPDNAEGISLRTVRAYCGEECPLLGIIWYDDFKLERI